MPSARWGHFCTYMQILKFTFNHLFWILKKSKGNRCRIHYLCYSPIALKICSLCIFKIHLPRNLSLQIYKCGTQFQLCKFFFSKSTNTSYQIYIIATFGAFSPTSETALSFVLLDVDHVQPKQNICMIRFCMVF